MGIFGFITSLSVSASTLIVFFILKRKYFYRVIIFLSVIVIIFIVYGPLRDFALLMLRFENGLSGRDQLWTISLDMIRNHPIFGIGPGAYKYMMFDYFSVMLGSWLGGAFKDLYEITNGSNLSHNFFLFFFSDMGIFGFITALALPIIFFKIGIKTLTKYKNGEKNTFYLIVALFAAGAVCLSEAWLIVSGYYIMVQLLPIFLSGWSSVV